jgi:hypothetical protein
MEQTYMRTHGADDRHTSMQVDGMTVNSSMGDGNIQAYNDDALAQQVVFQTSGMPAEEIGRAHVWHRWHLTLRSLYLCVGMQRHLAEKET